MKNLITKNGEIKLNLELEKFKSKKNEIILEIERSRKFGDLSENAEYHSAKNSLFSINKKIQNIEKFLLKAKVIKKEDIKNKDIINFSAEVEIENLEKNNIKIYRIVSNQEINFDKINISVDSMIGKALIGKTVNDIINIKRLNKRIKYKVISIKY